MEITYKSNWSDINLLLSEGLDKPEKEIMKAVLGMIAFKKNVRQNLSLLAIFITAQE